MQITRFTLGQQLRTLRANEERTMRSTVVKSQLKPGSNFFSMCTVRRQIKSVTKKTLGITPRLGLDTECGLIWLDFGDNWSESGAPNIQCRDLAAISGLVIRSIWKAGAPRSETNDSRDCRGFRRITHSDGRLFIIWPLETFLKYLQKIMAKASRRQFHGPFCKKNRPTGVVQHAGNMVFGLGQVLGGLELYCAELNISLNLGHLGHPAKTDWWAIFRILDPGSSADKLEEFVLIVVPLYLQRYGRTDDMSSSNQVPLGIHMT
ncbi:hypothetical protein B0H14DRAFT_2645131 [Mycena olivaceomarginata]|nr:hypothetical protein B0H14DRAFT_2645131 [Mycena olivaceomarginata]